MKLENVPQEKSKTYAGKNKILYAVDDKGEYDTIQSNGWHVEEIVTTQAVEEINRLVEEATERVKAGQSVPLEVHMYRCRLDVLALSQATGFFQWRIRRHFRPHIFRKLKPVHLQRYSGVLGLTVEELMELPAADRKG